MTPKDILDKYDHKVYKGHTRKELYSRREVEEILAEHNPSINEKAFIEWLDEEIAAVNYWKTMGGDPYFFVERDTALKFLNRCKEKFLTLTPTP